MKYVLMLCVFFPIAAFAADMTTQPAASAGVPSAGAMTKTMDAVNDVLAATVSSAPVAAPATNSIAAAPAATKQSLFFTPNQIASIMRAYQGFLAPSAAYDDHNQGANPSDTIRVIHLSGILFQSPGDWTIWLNGERVTPKNKPDHVIGLVVTKDRVFLRWMDIGNQRIVNLTLRAHESYNLDTDIITSGS